MHLSTASHDSVSSDSIGEQISLACSTATRLTMGFKYLVETEKMKEGPYLSRQPLLDLSPFLLFCLIIPFCRKYEERDDFPHQDQLLLPLSFFFSFFHHQRFYTAQLVWYSARSITHSFKAWGFPRMPMSALLAGGQLNRTSTNVDQPTPFLHQDNEECFQRENR